MRLLEFKPLITDMHKNQIDKEHYSFTFSKLRFDVILSVVQDGFEILVAIHAVNWGCVLLMDNEYKVEMPDSDYYSLRKILNLNWNKDHFNSARFLKLLSENAPRVSSCQIVKQFLTLTCFRISSIVVSKNQKKYTSVDGTIIKTMESSLAISIKPNFSLAS